MSQRLSHDRPIGCIYENNNFKIYLRQGKKGNTVEKIAQDRIIEIVSKFPHRITYEEFAIIARELSIIEENLYPRTEGSNMGRNKVLQLLKYSIQKLHWSIPDCCYQCQVPGYEDKLGLPKPRQKILFK